MARGKVVTKTLVDASQAAMFAGIEIHNKPNIAYRYPTAIILVVNAWELLLKAYVYKYINKRKVFESDGKHTISFPRALSLVKEDIIQHDKNFVAVNENLLLLNEYRCSNVHFANRDLDPVIFMLMGKAVLNYNDFLKKYFHKDITTSDNLIILPIGLKLPFDPIDYLKQDYGDSQNEFVNQVIQTIRSLNENNVEESVVIGFNLYTESIKKISNADIIAAIDQINGEIELSKSYRITDDPNAPLVRAEPKLYPLVYDQVYIEVHKLRPEIKKNTQYHQTVTLFKNDSLLCQHRYLDPNNKDGAKKLFYSPKIIDKIIEEYDKRLKGEKE